MLLVPKNDTNLRIRYACSLLCFELPTQKTESGPDSLRSASRRSPTSLIAASHVIACHLPLTSFIGVLSRCEFSCMPCSRTEAPLAQCEPRLSGESNTGSCRTHTPFSTIASTAQPTEQCMQTVRLLSRLVSVSAAASALPMRWYGNWLANAPAPATRPERFRNARRSIVGSVAPESRRRRGRAALSPSRILVSSMVRPPPMKPFEKLLRAPNALSCPRSLLAVLPCTASGLAAGLRAFGAARYVFPRLLSDLGSLVIRLHVRGGGVSAVVARACSDIRDNGAGRQRTCRDGSRAGSADAKGQQESTTFEI